MIRLLQSQKRQHAVHVQCTISVPLGADHTRRKKREARFAGLYCY